MFKQLFLSTALATAFIAAPVIAGDHDEHDAQGDTKTYDNVDRDGNKVTPDKKAYDKNNADDEKANHPAHDMEGSDVERKNTQGETKSYEKMDRDGEVRPDKKAYDKNGNGKHPAHEMGEGDPAREQGQ